MESIDDLLRDLQKADIIWTRATHGRAMYEAIYRGEPVKLRLNDFPDDIAYTLFVRGEEIDLEESPEGWHLTRR